MKKKIENMQVYDFSNLDLQQGVNDNCFSCDGPTACENCDNCDCDGTETNGNGDWWE